MSLYYFDLCVFGDLSLDEEGTELPSMDDVQDEAAYALMDLLKEQTRASDGHPLARYLAVEVRDASGPLLNASFLFEIKRTIQ